MSRPATPTRCQRRRPTRSGVAAAALALALTWLLAACGDDGRSTGASYRLIISTCQDRLDQRATGVAIGPSVVATVAHSLEDATGVELRRADRAPQSAEVILLDLDKDIALLRPTGPLPHHLDLAEPQGPGPVGVLRHEPDDRAIVDRGRITELVDITLDGQGLRAAARLEATIEPGDSGAAVLDDDGDMVAMVFATARDRNVGWAISAVEIQAALDGANISGPEVDPPAC